MASPQDIPVTDGSLLAFVERLIDKGMYPALIVIGCFYLVAKFGWPWRQDFSAPVPQEKGVTEALGKLDDKLDAFRLEVVQRLTRLETKMKLPPQTRNDE